MPTKAKHTEQTGEAPKRVMPKRIVSTHLPAPYDGFSVKLWMNPPRSVMRDLASGDEDRTRGAMQALVLESDLVGFDGEELPSPTTPDFWNHDAVSTDLGAAIFAAYETQIGDFSSTGRKPS